MSNILDKLAASNGLLFLCLTYTVAAANEYWLLNWLSSIYDIKLPIFAALLQNASWPIQIIFYRIERKKHFIETLKERVVTPAMFKSYCILGGLSAFITLTRTMGITSLPPTIYVIAANTEIVFETIMTKVILRKTVSYLQLLAVSLVLGGVAVSLYDPTTGQYGSNENVSQEALLVGMMVSLLSRLASSLNTILADR
jgi:drug/metabolite transporter (DMT)-like permease